MDQVRSSRGRVRRGATALAAAVMLLAGGALQAQSPEPATGAAPRSMTLDQAVASALEHSPQMVQGEGSVRNAAASEKAAKGSFLPDLSVSTGASLNGSDRISGLGAATGTGVARDATSLFTPSSAYTAGVSASMDIFDGGKRSAQLARSRAVSTQADATLSQQQNDVALAAKSGFFDALRAAELVKAAQAESQRATDALGAAQKRLNAGAATRSDVLRAQLAVTQARQALSQAQSQQRTAEYALGRTVGYDGAVVPQATGGETQVRPLALSPAQLDSLVTTQTPAVQVAQAALSASTASISAAKADYLPKLSLGAGYDWAHQSTSTIAGDNSWSVRAAVTLPLFDGFQRDAALTEAKTAADEARATLDDARRGQRVELQKDLAALEDAGNQIDLGQQAVKAAEEDLRVQQERYRLGAATMLDVITSQAALAQAEQKLVNARYDYQVARAQVEAMAGRGL